MKNRITGKKGFNPLYFFIFVFFFLYIIPGCKSPSPLHVKSRLMTEVKSIEAGHSFSVGLSLKMEEGWHTYWENPGDSGLPTTIKWELPEGYYAGEIQWPYPYRIETSGIVSFGYEDEVLLLTDIQVPATAKPGTAVQISAGVDWLVCKEECLPEHADLVMKVPVRDRDPKIDPKKAAYFDKFRNKIPKASEDWELEASGDREKIRLQALSRIASSGLPMDIFFFPEEGVVIDHSEPQTVEKLPTGYVIEMKRSKFSSREISRLKGVLFSEQGWDASGQLHALLVDIPIKYND